MSSRNQSTKGSGPLPRSESGREVTESIAVEPDNSFDPEFDGESQQYDGQQSSLAMGTHDSKPRTVSVLSNNDYAVGDNTKVATPMARVRTPQPLDAKPKAPQGTKPPPVKSALADQEGDSNIGTTMGSYRVIEIVGKGGMGYVYRAEHIKLGREVALKLLRSDYSKRRDAVARFFQEARTVNRVRHRNIVDVTDFVEIDDGTTFIIMEFLRGTSLGRWSRSKIDLPRALAILVQICDGLAAAHAVGVIHRDLKPDNIFVEPQADGTETAKILDFGVAKLLNRDDEDIGFQTAAGSVIGTPAYMSPEQAGGMTIDGRSDIYSLGAIMYELFTGQTMFKGRSFGEFVRKHLTEIPTPPHQTVGGATIDPRVEALVIRCIEKEPSRRFGSAADLRDSLLHILAGFETQPPTSLTNSMQRAPALPPTVMTQAIPVAPPAYVMPSADNGTMQFSGSMLQSGSMMHSASNHPALAKASPWPWIVGVGLALGAAIGVGWYALSDNNSSNGVAIKVTPGETQIAATALAAPPAAKLVEVRFEATPSGGVFVEGGSVERCHTPCSLSIDLSDGGSTTERTFMIRAPGRVDAPIIVDVKPNGRREYAVTLAAKPVAVAPLPPEKIDPPKGDGSDADVVDPAKNNGKHHRNGKGDSKVENQPEIVTEAKPDNKSDAKVTPDTKTDAKNKPVTGKVPQNPTKILPSDTIDPFKPR
jgi:serine/threonine protein kinase